MARPHAGVAGGYLWRLNPSLNSSRIFGVLPRAVRPPINRSGRVWPRSRPTRRRGHDAAARSAQRPSWHLWLRAQPTRTPLGLSICARAADRGSAASEWAAIRATEERPSLLQTLAEISGGDMDCGSRGPLRAWRRAGGGWARREGAHRQEVLVAAEPSQRSRARAWRPEWCPHEHTNSPTDRGGARHRDLRPRPDEGWNRAEAASSCHSRCRLFFAAERWRRSFFRRK